LLVVAGAAAAIEPPFEAVRRGAHCNLEIDGSLSCRYRAGRDLEFVLRRVGEPGVRLVVERSSDAGDYLVDPKMMGPCVFVRHGTRGQQAGGSEFEYAIVSSRNGFVSRALRDCRGAR
jgi:hypothetical protein